jgi:hypothetical protein
MNLYIIEGYEIYADVFTDLGVTNDQQQKLDATGLILRFKLRRLPCEGRELSRGNAPIIY